MAIDADRLFSYSRKLEVLGSGKEARVLRSVANVRFIYAIENVVHVMADQLERAELRNGTVMNRVVGGETGNLIVERVVALEWRNDRGESDAPDNLFANEYLRATVSGTFGEGEALPRGDLRAAIHVHQTDFDWTFSTEALLPFPPQSRLEQGYDRVLREMLDFAVHAVPSYALAPLKRVEVDLLAEELELFGDLSSVIEAGQYEVATSLNRAVAATNSAWKSMGRANVDANGLAEVLVQVAGEAPLVIPGIRALDAKAVALFHGAQLAGFDLLAQGPSSAAESEQTQFYEAVAAAGHLFGNPRLVEAARQQREHAITGTRRRRVSPADRRMNEAQRAALDAESRYGERDTRTLESVRALAQIHEQDGRHSTALKLYAWVMHRNAEGGGPAFLSDALGFGRNYRLLGMPDAGADVLHRTIDSMPASMLQRAQLHAELSRCVVEGGQASRQHGSLEAARYAVLEALRAEVTTETSYLAGAVFEEQLRHAAGAGDAELVAEVFADLAEAESSVERGPAVSTFQQIRAALLTVCADPTDRSAGRNQ